jgi:uncharacterized protein (DUF39 family)
MKKLLLISMVVLLVLAFATPGSAEPPTGFVMTGTDAASAEFADDGCDVFVGYVWAKRVRYFATGEVVSPHSDVDVKLSGTCGTMSGTYGPVVGNPLTEIVKLESAFVDGIVVSLDSGYTAVVDLEWTATGDVYKVKHNEPGMRASHQTRDATVTATGTVTIMDGTEALLTFGTDDLYSSIITHYNEVQNSNLS